MKFSNTAAELIVVFERAACYRHLSNHDTTDMTAFETDVYRLAGVAYERFLLD